MFRRQVLIALSVATLLHGTVMARMPFWDGGTICTECCEGNPVGLDDASKQQSATDFEMPVKQGLTLELSRSYISEPMGMPPAIWGADSMLGNQWAFSYEMMLVYSYSNNNEYYYLFEPGYGSREMGWNSTTSKFETYTTGGNRPLELTRTGSAGNYVCTVRDESGRELGFSQYGTSGNNTYRLDYIEKDYNTDTQERLTFGYLSSTTDVIDTVTAPSGDGRYLKFTYKSAPANVNQIEKATLHVGSNSYDLVFYSIDTANNLQYVRYNSATQDTYHHYEYGSMDWDTGTSTYVFTNTDKAWQLGRISQSTDSAETSTSSYAYNGYPSFADWVKSSNRWSSSLAQWKQDFLIGLDSNGLPDGTMVFGEGSG